MDPSFKWHPLTESHSEVPNTSDVGPSEIAISLSGSIFAVSDDRGSVRLFSYEEFICLYQLTSEDTITGLCFTHDSRRFLDIRGSNCNIWEPNALIRYSELEDKPFEANSEARSLSSVSFAASEARVEPLVTVTQIAARKPGPVAYYGNSEGDHILQDHRDHSRIELATTIDNLELTSLTLSQDGRCLTFEDISGTVTVASIEVTGSSATTTLKLAPIMCVKPRGDNPGTKHVVISQDSKLLFLAENSEAQIWDIDTRAMCARHNLPATDCRVWCSHPAKKDEMLAFKAEDITLCVWTDQRLRPKHKWKAQLETLSDSDNALSSARPLFARQSTSASNTGLKSKDSGSRIEKILSAMDGSLLLLFYSNTTMRSKAHRSPRIRFIRTSDLDPSLTSISPISLPTSIESLMERPLTVLKGGIFVFIDTAFWIRRWKLVLANNHSTMEEGAYSEKVVASSRDAATEEGDPKASKKDANDVAANSAVKRHYFLPRDWIDAQSLALCMMPDDGTLLCPRKGEVAAIKSGLGSEW